MRCQSVMSAFSIQDHFVSRPAISPRSASAARYLNRIIEQTESSSRSNSFAWTCAQMFECDGLCRGVFGGRLNDFHIRTRPRPAFDPSNWARPRIAASELLKS